MDYLTELGLSNEEISNINPALVESLTLFPLVVKENFSTVRELKLLMNMRFLLITYKCF